MSRDKNKDEPQREPAADEPARPEPPARSALPGRQVPFIRYCAWCNRLEQDGQWVVADLDTTAPAVSHSICPSCAEGLLAEEAGRQGDRLE